MSTYDPMRPLIIFGAFDRHNFGDLLFAHVAAALAPGREIRFAGLLQRDLRPSGGRLTEAITDLAQTFGERDVEVLHAGGELLPCSAFEAAVMLQPPAQMDGLLQRYAADPLALQQWTEQTLRLRAQAPYCIGRDLFPHARIVYRAIGGVELDRCPASLRDEVFGKLRAADEVSARDRHTARLLAQACVPVRLLPDPAAMTAELFGTRITSRRRQGEVGELVKRFPQGYIAVQFSSAFGDDRTLAAIAAALDETANATGWGVVLFCAGTAAWHDDAANYRRLRQFLQTPNVHLLVSDHLWDICGVIAGCRLFAGSSLHGRIVAMAFSVPRINLVTEQLAAAPTKQREYAATWDLATMPSVVMPDQLAAAIAVAMAIDTGAMQALATRLAADVRAHIDIGSGMNQASIPTSR